MQTAQTKTLIMAANGTVQSQKPFDWQGLLLALAISVASGSFLFAWNTNTTMAIMQEQIIQQQRYMDEIRQDMNQIKLDIRDLRDRAIRAERIQKTN